MKQNSFLTTSFAISKNDFLHYFFNAKINHMVLPKINKVVAQNPKLLVWKKNYHEITSIAKEHHLTCYCLEDAPISFIKNKKGKDMRVGMIIDDSGAHYYDSKSDSFVDKLLKEEHFSLSNDETSYAQKSIDKISRHNITKYNDPFTKNAEFTLEKSQKKSLLILDQVEGDFSITSNNLSKDNFILMYEEALKKEATHDIYVKLHPKGKGYLEAIIDKSRVKVIDSGHNIMSVLKKFDEIYTISSQSGFEALLLGKQVSTFGISFYSGYGVTHDHMTQAARPERSVLEIFHAFYIKSAKYYVNNMQVRLVDILDMIILNHHYYVADSQKRFFVYGVALWKRLKFINYFASQNIFFIKDAKALEKLSLHQEQDQIVCWGDKTHDLQLQEFKEKHGLKIVTVEDGFIRSIGLGSNLVEPSSLCLDDRGIYYNPDKESRLDDLQNNYDCSDDELKESKDLVANLLKYKVNKYGISATNDSNKLTKKLKNNNKKISLVIEQVADDLSVNLGATGTVKNNLDLLKEVREKFPNNFIIYKHHPDVIVKNRASNITKSQIEQYADLIIQNSLEDAIKHCDDIHVLTSLTGFESLLRNKKVFTYGLPFFAGWGLTNDNIAHKNRTRTRNLNEFCYITLFKYCRYYDWNNNFFLSPNIMVEKLYNSPQGTKTRLPNNCIFHKNVFLTKIVIVRNCFNFMVRYWCLKRSL